jgi:hypothetical protein
VTAPVRLAERSLLSVAEAASYASVSASTLTDSLVPVLVTDPWSSAGSLVERRAVDAWWRQHVLARPTG